MTRSIRTLALSAGAALVVVLAAPARAQSGAPLALADAPAAPAAAVVSAPVAAPAPTVALPAPVAATRAPGEAALRRDAARAGEAAARAGSRGDGQVYMIVGGAAFLAGALIGGDAGTIVMLGGAGVGIYGLYLYLQ